MSKIYELLSPQNFSVEAISLCLKMGLYLEKEVFDERPCEYTETLGSRSRQERPQDKPNLLTLILDYVHF